MKQQRIPKRVLLRTGTLRLYFWPAIPPEAPHHSYHCFDASTGERAVFPNQRQAEAWLDTCPINRRAMR